MAREGQRGCHYGDAENGLQVLRGGLICLERCYRSGRLQTEWQEILGILRAQDNTSFVPSSAHGLRGKELRAFGSGWEDETSAYLCANQYSRGPSGLL